MTLVEVMVAIVILTVSVYLLSSTVTATIAHSSVKHERALAVEASMNMLERMRSEPFEELFANYNDNPEDDPAGAGTAPGMYFDILGLDPQKDDPDGFVGEVILPAGGPSLSGGAGDQVREDMEYAPLSMPRDLNGDLMIDDADHADDYIVLPVTVRVAWHGKGGRRQFEMSTMFAKLEKIEE